MCLILFSLDRHPVYRLVFAANRDEFYNRPTSPADFRRAGAFIAGKDLKSGGTWMGITKTGRFAAVTNYREGWKQPENTPSRGHLVRDFLTGDLSPRDYLEKIKMSAMAYNGFNLLAGNTEGLYYYSNRDDNMQKVPPGIHGISNHLLDTPWPKVQKGKRLFSEIMSTNMKIDPEDLFTLLGDQSKTPDEYLPETGIGMEWERILSPIFIVSDIYGTRSSSVILWDKKNNIEFFERNFHPVDGKIIQGETRVFRFSLKK